MLTFFTQWLLCSWRSWDIFCCIVQGQLFCSNCCPWRSLLGGIYLLGFYTLLHLHHQGYKPFTVFENVSKSIICISPKLDFWVFLQQCVMPFPENMEPIFADKVCKIDREISFLKVLKSLGLSIKFCDAYHNASSYNKRSSITWTTYREASPWKLGWHSTYLLSWLFGHPWCLGDC